LKKINQRKNKKQIAEKKRELQIILDSIPAWIFYKDKENRFVKVNEAFCEVMGKTKKELEGKSCFDIYPIEQAEAFLKDDLEVIKSEKPKRNIVELMGSAKGKLWIKTDKIPYTDKSNSIIGIIGFSVDVTDQIQTNKNLERATSPKTAGIITTKIPAPKTSVIRSTFSFSLKTLPKYAGRR